MNERVSAIVDAVRLRVEDELRSVEADHQRRLEEQQQKAEAASREADARWTAQIQSIETQARARLEEALAAARAEFDRQRTDERASAAGHTARVLDFQGALDRCGSLSDTLDLLVREIGSDGALLLYRAGDWQTWASPDGASSPLAGGWTLMAERVREAGRSIVQDGLHAVPLTLDKKTIGVVVRPSADATGVQMELVVHATAARLAVLTATRVSQAMAWTGAPARPSNPASSSNGETDTDPDGSARRYARLLVSELKLYNESAVLDGRAHRDLAQRLGGEIAAARRAYEARVAAPSAVDHFQHALVEILADGDAALLA